MYRGTSPIRTRLQGYLAQKEMPKREDPPRTLGIGLRLGTGEVRFIMSEVPLYCEALGQLVQDEPDLG